jgi:hypothetical protein
LALRNELPVADQQRTSAGAIWATQLDCVSIFKHSKLLA